MKKILALILALVMIFSLVACASSDDKTNDTANTDKTNTDNTNTEKTDDKVYTVSIQYSFPEPNAGPLDAVLKQMEEESNGRLKFEIYYSNAMFANADVLDALEANTLNIAGIMPVEYATLQLNGRACGIPFMGFESWQAANDIYLKTLYAEDSLLMKEYTDAGLVFWAGSMCPGYQFYTAKEIDEVSPSMFNGLTLMTENTEMQTFIGKNGGAAIAAFPPDFYANLSNGVADGLLQHLNCVTAFGVPELVKTAVFFGEGGFYNYPIVYVMGQGFWDSLPEDLQDLFAKYSSVFAKASYDNDVNQYEGNIENLMAKDTTLITLDEAQVAEWQAAFQPIVDSVLDELGADAKTVYDTLMAEIAAYDAATYEVGTNNFGVEYVH